MASHIREYAPKSIHMITRRMSQGQFLHRPDEGITQAELFTLGYCQMKYDVGIHAASDVLNHEHIIVTDHHGDRIGLFMQEHFSLLARYINCYWGRWQNVWDSHKASVVAIAPRAEDLIDKMSYVANNVVAAGLVKDIREWPGVQLVATSVHEQVYRIKRPKIFFKSDGDMPEEVELRITLPKVWDASPQELAEAIEARVKERGEETRLAFRMKNKKFLGRERVLKIDPTASPNKSLSRFGLNPTVACKDARIRKNYLRRLKARRIKYRSIREELQQGTENLIFPEGSLSVYLQFGQDREEWQGCIWSRAAAEP